VAAGRRGGKTYLAMTELARAARYPNKNVWYVSPSYRRSKQIMWDQLKGKLIAVNWIDKVNESDLSLLLKNGSKIALRGADNFDSLRGVALDFLAMDEFAYIDKRAWTDVLRATLSDREGRALFITTPSGTANWAYDLYQRGKNPADTHWQSFQYTTAEGGMVSLDEIEQARQDLDERTFRQEYESSFESYSNRCYYAFDIEQNVKQWDKPIPSILHIGCDFNNSPITAAIFSVDNGVMHLFDEINMNTSNTDELAEEIRNRYPSQKIIMYPDPSGKRTYTSSGGRSDHTILTNAGFIVKAPNKHNHVRDGINAVNSKLKNSLNVRTLFVNPKCKKSIESLLKYSYKDGTQVPDKDNIHDHMADSIRYAVDYLFPVKRVYGDDKLQPQRWGAALA